LLAPIAGWRIAAEQPGVVRKEHDALVVHQDVLDVEELQRLDAHLDFLHAFPDQRLLRVLVPVDISTGHPPQAAARLDVAEDKKDASAILDQRRYNDLGVAEENPIALWADAQALLCHQPGLRFRPAAGAVRVHRLRLSCHPAGSTNAAAASLIAAPIKNGKSPK